MPQALYVVPGSQLCRSYGSGPSYGMPDLRPREPSDTTTSSFGKRANPSGICRFREALAHNIGLAETSVSQAIHRPTFIGELEPYGRQNPLWVAKQHGHSISTMLRVYAAWAEGAVESDIEAIKRSMIRHARLKPTASCLSSAGSRPRGPRPTHPRPKRATLIGKSPEFGNLAVDLPVETGSKTQVPDNWWKFLAEREGFEPSKGF